MAEMGWNTGCPKPRLNGLSTSIACTIRGFAAWRRISAAATSGSWLATMIDEHSRPSLLSQRSMLQSLIARASSAAK